MNPVIHPLKKLFWLLLPLVAVTSCMKDVSEEFVPDPGNPSNDTTWYDSPAATATVHQLDTLFRPAALADSLAAETGGLASFENGIQVKFPAGFCQQQNGGAVKGRVKIDLLFLEKKGDFIRFARSLTSNNLLLQSAAALRLSISQKGQPLALAANTSIQVHLTTNTASPNAVLLYGDSSRNYPFGFNWLYTPGNNGITYFQQYNSQLNAMVKGYDLLLKKLNWGLCAQVNADSVSRVKLSVVLPPNFTNANTAVYAVSTVRNTVVRLIPDRDSRTFAGLLPQGDAFTVLSLSRIDTQLYWSQSAVELSGAMVIKLQPAVQTRLEIARLLDTL